MASTSYIPGPDIQFNSWQINLHTRVVASAVTWVIPAGRVTAFTAAKGVYDPLYAAIANKNERTTAQVTAHREGRAVYETFVRQFVQEHLARNSAISNAQRAGLGITVRDTTSTARPAITTAPTVDVDSKKGSRIQLTCKVAADSTRASKHRDADDAEVRYAIGTTAPANALAAPNRITSKSARIVLQLSPDDVGKKCYVFVRWHNSADETKSGPWSLIIAVTVVE